MQLPPEPLHEYSHARVTAQAFLLHSFQDTTTHNAVSFCLSHELNGKAIPKAAYHVLSDQIGGPPLMEELIQLWRNEYTNQ